MKFLKNRFNLIIVVLTVLFSSAYSIETFLFTQNFLGGTLKNGLKMSNDTTNHTIPKIVTESPYRISACDQVIEIEGKTLEDYHDFSLKADAFFTLSVYMVNLFEKKSGDSLKTSISLDKMLHLPKILPGSVSCIDFNDSTDKHLAICLNTKEDANHLLKAFSQFMKCRMGDSLKTAPAKTVKNIMKASCLGLDVSFDVAKFGGDINKGKAALQTAMDKALKNAAASLKNSVKKEGEEKDAMEMIDSNASSAAQSA